MRLPTTSRRSACACACVIGATLLFPIAAAGEEIRVLFVPSQDLASEVQTKALQRAISELSNSVRAVSDLADADVLIQFTDYRVEQRKKDGPWRWWEGQVKILLRPEGSLKDAAQALRLPERFSLLIMGESGGTEMERTVATFEHFLRKALGRDAAKHGRELI
jgi:hypothetical protein